MGVGTLFHMMSSSKCVQLLVVLSILLAPSAGEEPQLGLRNAEEQGDGAWEDNENDFEVKMDEGGRLSGRLATIKDGKRIGLVFSAGGAMGDSPSIKTLNGKVLLSPLRVSRTSQCRILQVSQSTFVDCPHKGGTQFRAIDKQIASQGAYPLTGHKPPGNTFIHTQEDSNTLFYEAVNEVLRTPEAHLLPVMSQELGRFGFHGHRSSPALQLHITAQRFSTLLQGSSGSDVTIASKFSRKAMMACALDKACPPCKDKNCIGMCGPRCFCWKWVCGDCCYHKGCHGHDICCAEKGYFSWACLFPRGLKCNKMYKC